MSIAVEVQNSLSVGPPPSYSNIQGPAMGPGPVREVRIPSVKSKTASLFLD